MPIVQHLIVDQYGVHVSKQSERLKVMRLGKGTPSERLVQQAPLMHLESVLISGRGISLSADAIEACCKRGIPIHFVSRRGQPYAGLYAAGLTGTVQTRRAQLAAYNDDRGVALSLAFAQAKICNQAALLKYLARNRRESDAKLALELGRYAGEVLDHIAELERLEGACVEDIRERLLSVEGRAARRYWEALKNTVPAEYNWPGRERRGANDPVNAALNYGYGILYAQIERAAVLAGLDPYGGFTHVDRPGKPSLVLDLIEEFRVPAVDRTVIGLVNRGTRLEQDEKGLLVEEARRLLAEHILSRLEKPERYEGKRHALRAIIQQQARHVATCVRRQRAAYKPFTVSW
jgi:CRISPR-associated protein Cas1